MKMLYRVREKFCCVNINLKTCISMYRVYKKLELGRFFMFFRQENLLKNDPIRANFMREIDCGNFQRFPKPESGNRSVCIEAKIENC
jgi:hypothetical protein